VNSENTEREGLREAAAFWSNRAAVSPVFVGKGDPSLSDGVEECVVKTFLLQVSHAQVPQG